MQTIFYTKTDESPLLATYSLLPIFKAFTKSVGINFKLKDISLSRRILSSFCNFDDDLKFLGEVAQKEDANIIKLPNISASLVQLKAAIKELQKEGFDIPDYIDSPRDEKEEEIKRIYSKILGSAVNPVLREGNSDRRAPKAVKNYAKKYPHFMGEWTKDSKTRVSSMKEGDFYASEESIICEKDDDFKIVFTCNDGGRKVLKESIEVGRGDIIDSSFMSIKKLEDFYKEQIKITKDDDILLSLHLKATMMKISDPVIFGVGVKIFFQKLFDKYADEFKALNINPNNGLGDLEAKILNLPQYKEIREDIKRLLENGPNLAMVNSDKGVTNLHVPNDVIVDSSMPLMIRFGGKMYDFNGELKDTNALIPDRSYAGVYQSVIDDCKQNGALDVKTIGSVSNIGLMAKKAQEYGSHDKTFIIEDDGVVEVINKDNRVIFKANVEKGDIYRVTHAKDEAIRDWVKLAFNRANETKLPAIFWLDDKRASDKNMIKKVEELLNGYDLLKVDISILNPKDATKLSLKRMREGKDTISVSGNVMRDYLTDLFPILELGTSSKMLSIVPLMNGGGMFETGAGGTAPVLIDQLLKENHFIWDSLGEYMALFASLEFIANKTKDKKIALLASTLDSAIESILDLDKSPKPNCGELDCRGSHFYLSYFWAKQLCSQSEDTSLSDTFKPVFKALDESLEQILYEFTQIQGKKVNLNGYFHPNVDSLDSIMRASKSFNEIIDKL